MANWAAMSENPPAAPVAALPASPDLPPLDLAKVLSGQPLSGAEAEYLMGRIMDGLVSPLRVAAILTALRVRGENVAEISGFARAMRERAIKVVVAPGMLFDTCGTGGLAAGTFNISTTTAFVMAAAGLRIAKHGNRGATRASGSADVLEALGVRLDLTPAALSEAIETVGIAFLFARNHHPAMRHVAPVRAELGVRTVFNILGPLTNPAGASHQVLGVFDPKLVPTLAAVLRDLGLEAALVVHGSSLETGDRYDDLAVTGPTLVAELRHGHIREYQLDPREVGLALHPPAALRGGDPQTNAAITRSVLSGQGTPAQRDAVAFNAGAALALAGRAPDLKSAVEQALELLASGVALAKLEAYRQLSQRG
jgi:anthranilate phosphoribosyltransferase